MNETDRPPAPGTSLPPNLPAPAYRALVNAGYETLEQVTAATAAELLRLHGFGPKGLRLLRECLAQHGLKLTGE
jgi:DNA-directed RNA polymerase alpha subunit